jgi:hypothetical protein
MSAMSLLAELAKRFVGGFDNDASPDGLSIGAVSNSNRMPKFNFKTTEVARLARLAQNAPVALNFL